MATSLPKSRELRAHLTEAVLHLGAIRSVVAVAAAALRHQACELDEDVAVVLQNSVSDRLQDQIERLQRALDLTVSMERGRKVE